MEEITSVTGALLGAVTALGAAITVLWRRVEKGLEECDAARQKCESELTSLLYRLTAVAVAVPKDRRKAQYPENPGRRYGDYQQIEVPKD